MSSICLSIRDLGLTTSQGVIVKNFSLDISKSEIIALTGKSGSGKSSIAHAIIALLPPGIQMISGQITFFSEDGSIIHQQTDRERWSDLRGKHIGFIQQDVFGAFDPILTIGKQMVWILKERSRHVTTIIEEELKEKMMEVGIRDVERIWNSYPHQLSGGQLQRCLLSAVMALKPTLLIADEPTSAIDKTNQEELLQVFRFLRDKYGIAILCITHEPSVVRSLADREIKLDSIDSILDAKSLSKHNGDSDVAVLEAKDLVYNHRFGGLASKRGARVGKISFTLHNQKCIGIIGESGSGKSTVAQMLVGLLIPDAGTLKLFSDQIDFHSSSSLKFLRSKVQLVMQDGRGSLHPNKTIGTLLNEVIRFQKNKKNNYDPEAIQVLQDVGLPSQVVDRTPGQLSGGECLRVSIARALLMQPEVVICDESTSALDIPTRDGIIMLFKSLMESRGLSLIVISHDSEFIRLMADEVLVMENGEVVEQGSVKELSLSGMNSLTRKIFSRHIISPPVNGEIE